MNLESFDVGRCDCRSGNRTYEELRAIADDTAHARRRLKRHPSLFRFLDELQELIAAARAERIGLSVITD